MDYMLGLLHYGTKQSELFPQYAFLACHEHVCDRLISGINQRLSKAPLRA
jgi:hypothetical protein